MDNIRKKRIEMLALILEKRSAAWQRSEEKILKGGLNEKGRKSYDEKTQVRSQTSPTEGGRVEILSVHV